MNNIHVKVYQRRHLSYRTRVCTSLKLSLFLVRHTQNIRLPCAIPWPLSSPYYSLDCPLSQLSPRTLTGIQVGRQGFCVDEHSKIFKNPFQNRRIEWSELWIKTSMVYLSNFVSVNKNEYLIKCARCIHAIIFIR